MKNILLIMENQMEYDFVKAMLSKVGFNVLSMQKGADMRTKFKDSFPDLVLTSVLGKQQEALNEFAVVREKRGVPKFVWAGALSRWNALDDTQKKIIDENIITPIQAEKLLKVIAHLLEMNSEELLDKYRELYYGENKAKRRYVVSDEERTKREQKYKEAVENVEASEAVLSGKVLKSFNDQAAGKANTTRLLDLKKEFLKKMFK